MKPATLIAAALAVLCPHCHEEQPDPDAGSFLWDPGQVDKHVGAKHCASCGESFVLLARKRISVP